MILKQMCTQTFDDDNFVSLASASASQETGRVNIICGQHTLRTNFANRTVNALLHCTSEPVYLFIIRNISSFYHLVGEMGDASNIFRQHTQVDDGSLRTCRAEYSSIRWVQHYRGVTQTQRKPPKPFVLRHARWHNWNGANKLGNCIIMNCKHWRHSRKWKSIYTYVHTIVLNTHNHSLANSNANETMVRQKYWHKHTTTYFAMYYFARVLRTHCNIYRDTHKKVVVIRPQLIGHPSPACWTRFMSAMYVVTAHGPPHANVSLASTRSLRLIYII